MTELFDWLTGQMNVWPFFTGLLLFFLAFIHPLIGGPLSVFIQTLMIAYFDSIWLGSLVMYGFNVLGIMVYYVAFHRFMVQLSPWLDKKKHLTQVLAWSEKKAPWQHVIALGLPFVYTYPLRITLVKTYPLWTFTGMLGFSYLMLNGFNLLIIYSVFGTAFGALPGWASFSIFLFILIIVYRARTSMVEDSR